MKKKRTKAYRPRQVALGGGLVAIANAYERGESAQPLRGDQVTDIGIAYTLSLTNLATGDASEEHWCCVVCALNIGMVLSETVFDGQHEQDFIDALDGAFRAKIRGDKSGSFRLDGDGLRAVKYALAVHDEQIKLAHRREIVAAMEVVHERLESGNVYSYEAK